MFSLIKQVFIVLLSFSTSSATKFVSSNDEPWIVGSTFINLNLVEIKSYPLLIALDK